MTAKEEQSALLLYLANNPNTVFYEAAASRIRLLSNKQEHTDRIKPAAIPVRYKAQYFKSISDAAKELNISHSTLMHDIEIKKYSYQVYPLN